MPASYWCPNYRNITWKYGSNCSQSCRASAAQHASHMHCTLTAQMGSIGWHGEGEKVHPIHHHHTEHCSNISGCIRIAISHKCRVY
jgi:hypothetical protein